MQEYQRLPRKPFLIREQYLYLYHKQQIMKHLFKLMLVFSIVIFAASCSKDDDGMTSTAASTLKSGTWKITLFVDNGTDETTDFNSFIFSFADGGVVTATNTALTATGTWSVGTDNSIPKLNLAFSTPALFVDLTEDWEIMSVTNTVVSLHHQSGGSGGMDMLTFTKN
jgi:hypothetical protein